MVAANNSALLRIPERRFVRRAVRMHRRGLRGSSLQTGVAVGSAAASSLVGVLAATGAIAGPVGAAIGAGIGLAASLITTLFQPNYQKIQASNDANQIEQALKDNLAAWLALPASQKTQAVQAAALAVFDSGWAKYSNAVQPLLNRAPNSISDRHRGSCAYHTAGPVGWVNGVYQPNTPNQPSGVCWNWFVGYRDPIANDPNVIPDSISEAQSVLSGSPVSAGSSLATSGASAGSIAFSSVPLWAWLVMGGLGVWAVAS